MTPSPILAANIWEMMHGGSTHLPIALMLISAVFDGLGSVIRSLRLREQFHAAGLFTLIAATLGAFPAVLSGLVLARWDIGGTGPHENAEPGRRSDRATLLPLPPYAITPPSVVS